MGASCCAGKTLKPNTDNPIQCKCQTLTLDEGDKDHLRTNESIDKKDVRVKTLMRVEW